jgi:hypothetical protein
MTEWWKRHWFAEAPPHVFALYRICVGLAGCLTMLGLLDVPMLLSIDGIAPTPGGGLGIRAALQSAGLGTTAGWVLWAANTVGYVMVLIGLQTALASFIAFAASALILWWNPLPFSAGQHLQHMLTFYLLFCESGLVWSVDAWLGTRRGRSFSTLLQPIWPLRLLQYQVCLMYLAASLWKITDPTWRDGTALHYILNYNMFQRVPGDVPPSLEPLLAGLTYVTVAWEFLFTPAMLNRRTRNAFLLIGVGLHIGMWVLIDIGPFTPTVLAAYAAFLDPETVHRLAERRLTVGASRPEGLLHQS